MNTSELIGKLLASLQKHGDLPVIMSIDMVRHTNIESNIYDLFYWEPYELHLMGNHIGMNIGEHNENC